MISLEAYLLEDDFSVLNKVAKLLLDAPANGWEKWYYADALGQKYPIDQLRKKYLEMEADSA